MEAVAASDAFGVVLDLIERGFDRGCTTAVPPTTTILFGWSAMRASEVQLLGGTRAR